MNRVYELMIKLQDMVSPQMMKLAGTYGKVIGNMERKKGALGNIFNTAGQSVDSLRRKLLGLSSTPTRLRVDTSELDSATRRAGKLRDAMGRFTGGGGGAGGGRGSGGISGMLGSAMRGGALGGMLMGGIGGYIGMQSAQAIGAATISPAMEAERNQFSMGVMMHSPENAQILTDQLRKYAADNPLLGNAEVQGMGTQMVGLGYEMGKILPVMKSLGDVAAGSGNNLSELVTVLGQVKMKGRLQGEELMQFMERKVNLIPYLAKIKGVGEDKISQMVTDKKISYQDVESALGKMSGKGGIFDNMSERTANETSFGRYQKLIGDLENKGLDLGKAMLPYVEKVMGFVNQLMENIGPLEKGFSVFTSAVGGAWAYVSNLLKDLGLISEKGGAASLIMETLGVAFTYLGNAIKFVTGVLQAFTDSPLAMFVAGITAIPYLISLVSSAWVALNVAFTATPIGFIIAAVVGIVAALMTAYDKVSWFREGILALWETVKSVFSNMGSFLKMIFTGDVAGALAVISRTITEAGTNSVRAVKADRNSRIVAGIPKAVQGGFTPAGAGGGGGSGGGGLGGSTGLNSTVGNSKSQSININVGSLIAKSEIHVMDFNGDISQLESKIIESLSRLINSANQLAVS